MQPISDNEFDDAFRQRLASFEEEPSSFLWGRIEGEMELQSRRRKKKVRGWLAAASIVLALFTAMWFAMEAPVGTQVASRPPDVLATEKNSGAAPPYARTETAVPEAGGTAAQTKISVKDVARPEKKRVAARQAEENRYQTDEYSSAAEEAPLLANATIAEVVPVVQPQHMDVTSVDKLDVPPMDTKDVGYIGQKTLAASGKTESITSPGDLINFVVSKVDTRQDKIIEFQTDDEGALVSGINLGPIRFKSKQNRHKDN